MALCAVILFLVCAGGAWASARDFIPLDEISPGMTGYGLTVFEGTRIDTFGVVVVGVQPNVRADGSLLMIEVSGHGLEVSNIAQGMSGSPIYLDGKFAGALAFGWGGALRPIAGVTPAAEMLSLPTVPGEIPEAKSKSTVPEFGALIPEGAPDAGMMAEMFPGEFRENEGAPASEAVAGDWPRPDDLIMDLLANAMPSGSGSLPGPESWIVQPLGHGGQVSLQSGIEAGNTSTEAAFLPGSACAVPLITGDAKLGAIGTVTWVDRDQVLMMGHPFMQRGPVDWPLATAEILTIFPSRQMSFKMGSIGDIVGTVHHDLRAGLSGRTGDTPDLIPVAVDLDIQTGEGIESRSYAFKVVDDDRLTSTLVFWSLYNSLLAEGDDASVQTLTYRIETVWDGPADLSAEPLVLEGMTVGPGGAMGLAGEWMAPLNILLNNPFAEVRLKEVRARLTLTRPMATATITGVAGPRLLPTSGGQAKFQVELRPREGDPVTIEMPVTLPAHLEPGPYRVLVASAAELFAFEAQRAAGRFQVTNLGEMVDILRSERSRSTLVLALLAPGGNLVLPGQEMHNLPGSVANLIRAGNMQVPKTLADYVARSEWTGALALDGFAVRALRVEPAAEPFKEERRP